MKIDENSHPLWAGFLDLVRSIFVIEIGVYLYYALAMTEEMCP